MPAWGQDDGFAPNVSNGSNGWLTNVELFTKKTEEWIPAEEIEIVHY